MKTQKFVSGDLPGAAAALDTASEACSASFGRGCRTGTGGEGEGTQIFFPS
ncbi:MAG: hypothetical protein LBQ12_12175 [Deltaproteobacteria bacterium]|nr:hypothetical protein [Deltaproteobacteria bacterium]